MSWSRLYSQNAPLAAEPRWGWFECQWSTCRATHYAVAIEHLCGGTPDSPHAPSLMRPIESRDGLESTKGLLIDGEVSR